MKKIMALVLSVLMLLAAFPVLGVFAGTTPTFVAEAVEGEPGDTVTVNISTENNSGITSMKVMVGYDADVLQLVSIVGKDFTGMNFGPLTANPIAVNWVDTLNGNNTTDGVVAVLTFKILDTAAEGKSDITMTYDPDDVYDVNYDNVTFGIENGSVTVKHPPVAVTGVTLDKETVSLLTGETETLTATVNPDNATNKAVTWKSSNTAVATVDANGTVTAVKKGTATITVTTADGSFTDTCEVSVGCSHSNTTTHAAKASTCKEQGNEEYVTCDDCGIVVKGSDAKLPLAGHEGGTATCTEKAVCDVCKQAYGELKVHSYKEVVDAKYLKSEANCVSAAVYAKSCEDCGAAHATETFTSGEKDMTKHEGDTELKGVVAATCTADGYTGDTYCKDCGEKIKNGETVTAGHKTVEVPAKAATHEADGNIEYYTCSGCDKLFSDEAATTEITLADTVIAKGNHDYGDKYVSDAENHWKECECESVIEKAAHTFGDWVVTKEATETEKGSKEKTCSVCEYKVTEEIPAVEAEKDETDGDKSPGTGDNSNVLLWAVILTVAVCGLGALTVLRKRAR